ncbi:MAG: DUF1295 domain-containing protein [Pirellulaceae bacterium]|nr:DUF1295 domain-containing protein [Pirellulaceae bacterium]
MDSALTARVFAAFALACLAQRLIEMLRYDRHLQRRRPHWTARAMLLMHTAIWASAVVEAFVAVPPLRPGWRLFGAVLFLAGFLLRRWVLRTLRHQWSIDLQLVEGHQLIVSGPFDWCRHPNYLAILLEITGFCLLGQALGTLAWGLPAYALIVAARIVAEERMLIGAFGQSYRQYQRSRPMLFPWGGWWRRDVPNNSG